MFCCHSELKDFFHWKSRQNVDKTVETLKYVDAKIAYFTLVHLIPKL